jgi:hypothetical protein
MKKIPLLFLLLFSTLPGSACDICGCFMGITPYDNQSSFGLMHRYRIFSGYEGQKHPFFPGGSQFFAPRPFNQDGLPHTHSSGTGQHAHANPSDYEAFRVLELRAKYFIHQRVELNAFVPLVMNSSRFEGNTTHISGLGDVTLFAGYHVLRKIETLRMQHRLVVGGGVKVPTGVYDQKNPHTSNRYPMLLQRGTGSMDLFVYANYITGYKNIGLSLNASYKLNGENTYQEGIANSTATFANLFYRISLGKEIMLIPSAQLFYEFTKGETLANEPTGEHRMDNALLGPGLDVFYKNFSLNLACQLPVYEAKTNHPISAGRTVIGISYNMKQKKYLLPSKQ